MTELKICGLRRTEDVGYVNEFSPQYAGFILSDGFRRTVDLNTFKKLQEKLNSNIKVVGVFVNESADYILKYAPLLDVIQLHGDEDNFLISNLRQNFNGEIWKAVRAKSPNKIEKADKLDCDKLLIDSYSENSVGGTGKTVNLSVIKTSKFNKPYFLAGGVSEENLYKMLSFLKKKPPCGVDLSSSLEVDGLKDKVKIFKIVDLINRYNATRKKDI